MTSPRFQRVLRIVCVSLALAAGSSLFLRLSAYENYESDNRVYDKCAACHESTTQTIGFIGRGDLHQAHNSSATRNCDLCHYQQSGDVPFTNIAAGGDGCIGCHGQPIGTASSGAGLRRHHFRSGVTVCISCHDSDPVPPPESTVPVYYGRTDVLQTTPCNTDGAEDFWSFLTRTPDGRGLDNDGDLLVDAIEDPDCGASTCRDLDRDGYGDPGDPACPLGAARDCDDTRADTFPGAVEAYDTRDNNCNGEVDEIEGLRFQSSLLLVWTDQPPAGQLYDLIRSDDPRFLATSDLSACLAQATPEIQFSSDTTPVPAGRAFYYLVRNTLVADYGNASNGMPRLYSDAPFCP